VGQKSRIVLMTPAIVDFSKWLEDEDQLSIEAQVDVMARIACRRDGPRVHGFVGFDPLRQALYDHHQRKPTDKDPMAVVRGAIEVARILDGTLTKTTGGFVGVKLYPPMGFRAHSLAILANSELPVGSHGSTHLPERFRACPDYSGTSDPEITRYRPPDGFTPTPRQQTTFDSTRYRARPNYARHVVAYPAPSPERLRRTLPAQSRLEAAGRPWLGP
jgi:hypothetical protein